jgi:hypothetical protein
MLKQLLPYLTHVLVLAVMTWRLSRQNAGRPVKPNRLWIRPAILAMLLGFTFLHPPVLSVLSVAAFAAAMVAGGVLGYVLASHQALTIDPATGKITSKMSPIGIALFIGLFAGRYAFRMLITGGQAPDKLMAHSAQITLYTDVGLFFVLALVAAQAWELWRRTRPLVAEHAARTAGNSAEKLAP